MRPEAQRVSVILSLIVLGFLAWYVHTRDLMIFVYECWTLAAVYAILTSPRRFL